MVSATTGPAEVMPTVFGSCQEGCGRREGKAQDGADCNNTVFLGMVLAEG